LLLVVVIFLVVFFVGGIDAATYTCGTNGVDNSCTPAGLQAIIDDSNTVDGDIINIATGTHSWSSSVTVNKKITVSGGGSCPDCGCSWTGSAVSCTSNPLSTASFPTTLNIGTNGAFTISVSASSSSATDIVRITGIYFTGTGPTADYSCSSGHVFMEGSSNNADWRIDNHRALLTGDVGFIRSGSLDGEGLIDHIYYDNTASSAFVRKLLFSTGCENPHADWTEETQWGSEKFTYVENSHILFSSACAPNPPAAQPFDQEFGGRAVFRYNYITGGQAGNHGTESGCGSAPSCYGRGGVAFELYRNHMYWDTSGGCGKNHAGVNWRGGSGYIYENNFENYQNAIRIHVYRTHSSYACGICGSAPCTGYDGMWSTLNNINCVAEYDPYGCCTGAGTGICGIGYSYPSGYPCMDQIGTGQADGASTATMQPQRPLKSYIWSNTLTSTDNNIGNNAPEYLVDGRDYEFCTDNSCAPVGYISYTYPHPLATGGTCNISADCDDGQFCNGAEICLMGICQSGTNPCTDDGYSCTALCDEATDSCNVPSDILCNDGNVCTDDSCIGAGGDVNGCSYSFNTDSCNDGISCTENDVCSSGSCSGTPNNNLCLPLPPGCTSATCDIGLGCVYQPAGCATSGGLVLWLKADLILLVIIMMAVVVV
jgi:hypothetical protein